MPVNKPRRLGSFAPLSAQAYKDDALMEAGEAAELLFYRALSFSADVLRDGFISDSQLTRVVGHGMRDAPKRAERLVEVGLWGRIQGGYNVRSWLKWNRSRDEIEGLQVKDSGRKAAPRDDPNGTRPQDDEPSERNPNGIRTESEPDSEGSPDGVRTDSEPRVDACAPAPSLEPTPEPEPTPLRASDRKRSARIPNADPNAGAVVAAWVEAMAENDTTPTAGMRAQVGKLARELLAGNDTNRVLAAARQAGRKGYATIDRELAAMNGRPAVAGAGQRRDPKTGRAVDW